MEDIKKTQIDVREMKKAIFEIERDNTLDVIKNRSYELEEKISEPKTKEYKLFKVKLREVKRLSPPSQKKKSTSTP